MNYLTEVEAENLKTALAAQHFFSAMEALDFIEFYLEWMASAREVNAAKRVADLVAGKNRGHA